MCVCAYVCSAYLLYAVLKWKIIKNWISGLEYFRFWLDHKISAGALHVCLQSDFIKWTVPFVHKDSSKNRSQFLGGMEGSKLGASFQTFPRRAPRHIFEFP